MDYKVEFHRIIKAAIAREQKKRNSDSVQLCMFLKTGDKKNQVGFVYLQNFEANQGDQEVSFLNILDVKFDLKGYSLFVPRFVRRLLERLCESEKIEPASISIMIIVKNDVVYNMIYNNDKKVRLISDGEIFNDDTVQATMEEQMMEQLQEQLPDDSIMKQ